MESAVPSVTVRSYAKVNLTLDVLGIRPDGYHALESVMQTINLHDEITLSLGVPGVRVRCDVPGIPTDGRNLAFKAAALVLNTCGIAQDLDIHIGKRIPAEAGLGGGSSNGAAVIRGLNKMLNLALSQIEMIGLAAGIGSDVPFFAVGGTAFVTGRGERVEPLPDVVPLHLVIVKPDFGVSTAWAYKRLDEISTKERVAHSSRMVDCIRKEHCAHLHDLLGNDMEIPVLARHPAIAEIKEGLLGAGASGALMCGSGSAVFGVFGSEHQANEAAETLRSDRLQVHVTKTVSRSEAVAVK